MGKTNPLNENDLAEFVELQQSKADSDKSWSVSIADVDPVTRDLSVKNPNNSGVVVHRTPEDIMNEIAVLDAESGEVLANIRELL